MQSSAGQCSLAYTSLRDLRDKSGLESLLQYESNARKSVSKDGKSELVQRFTPQTLHLRHSGAQL